ncbi:MAG: hypothetical protein M4579_004488 [Chaenotheca gracillima]|nr:MAG: hypothetical protein M4579_004488 [Chaenotheca gracillima]
MTSTAAQPEKASSASSSTYGPIDLLHSEAARVFTHVHSVLILSLCYLRFDSLVEDPVSSLVASLLPLVVIQLSYVITCLPATSSSNVGGAGNAASSNKSSKAGAQRKKQGQATGGISSAIISTVLSTLLGTTVLSSLMVMFGAPVTTHLAHTAAAAAHLSLLAIMPLVYVHGVDVERWKSVISAMSPLDEVFGALVGTLVGAWLGAVPIPLDWDREWQKWPVTIVIGAYLGCVLGKILGGTILRGKSIKFD